MKLFILVLFWATYCWYMDEYLNGDQEKKKNIVKDRSWFK